MSPPLPGERRTRSLRWQEMLENWVSSCCARSTALELTRSVHSHHPPRQQQQHHRYDRAHQRRELRASFSSQARDFALTFVCLQPSILAERVPMPESGVLCIPVNLPNAITGSRALLYVEAADIDSDDNDDTVSTCAGELHFLQGRPSLANA